MGAIFQTIMLLINVAQFIVIAHVIMSWLLNFGVLNPRQQVVGGLWNGLNQLLDPVYSRIRRFLPQTGGLDLAPLVALLGLIILRYFVVEIFI